MKLRVVIDPEAEAVKLRQKARIVWRKSVDALTRGDTEEWTRLRKQADALDEQARVAQDEADVRCANALSTLLAFARTDNAPKGVA